MKLRNKVAVITGAGSGIGRETSILFAREGAKVVVTDLIPRAGEETVHAIRSQGGSAIFVKADISRSGDVKAIVEQTKNEFGRLDIIHNNAGITVYKELLDTEESDWDRIIDTNLKSVYLGSRYSVPLMIEQGGGSIISTASTLGAVAVPRASTYCASKGGVIALTRALAIELAPHKIRVNCICPGATETPMFDGTFKGLSGSDLAEARRLRLARIPLSRFGQPIDVANAALFLASDESSFITGAALFVDGGYTAQ